HGNESLTIFLTDVVNRANILMIQSRRRLRLALEAGQCLRVSGDFFGQKLEGNEAMQPRVLGFIHHTHTAAPELLDDAVVRDGLADHEAETSPVGDEHGSSLPGSSQRARPSSERNEYAGRALRARKNSFPERHPGQRTRKI